MHAPAVPQGTEMIYIQWEVTMNIQEMHEAKRTTVEQVIEQVKSNDKIWTSYNSLEPTLFLKNLHKIAPKVENVMIRHAGFILPYDFVLDPACKGHIVPITGFTDDYTRSMHDSTRNTLFIPSHLHNGVERCGWESPDIFVCMATPMDENGYFRMSLSLIAEKDILPRCKRVILEVNDKLPITNGETEVHISEIDSFYESKEPLVTIPDSEPGDLDMEIGRYVASLVPDGATIQLGIGNIPNAVAKFFMEKNDLGVHTEMITSSMAKLAKAGVITGKKKPLHPGKIVGNFAMGSQELYDFLNNNPSVSIMRGSYTNNPWVIAQNDNMVSINAALQVDMCGQICSESLGSVQYSGTGGAADFATGAAHSKGGKSIIAIRSTAKKGTISTIQPVLSPGSIVSISRNDIDYIVTEYGIARMRGVPVSGRVDNLINIAHPKFRDELRAGAEKYRLW